MYEVRRREHSDRRQGEHLNGVIGAEGGAPGMWLLLGLHPNKFGHAPDDSPALRSSAPRVLPLECVPAAWCGFPRPGAGHPGSVRGDSPLSVETPSPPDALGTIKGKLCSPQPPIRGVTGEGHVAEPWLDDPFQGRISGGNGGMVSPASHRAALFLPGIWRPFARLPEVVPRTPPLSLARQVP